MKSLTLFSVLIQSLLIICFLPVDTSAMNWEWHNPYPTTESLNDLWLSPEGELFAVGDSGTIAHYSDGIWTLMDSGTIYSLIGIWGTSKDDIYAVSGSSPEILHYDGNIWTETSFDGGGFSAIWGSASNDIFAVGQRDWSYHYVYHYDGQNWTMMTIKKIVGGWSDRLVSVWGSSSNNVFAVGTGVFHYDGTTWTTITEITSGSEVWGSSENNVFIVGTSDKISHFDGSDWTEIAGVSDGFSAIWGNSDADIFAISDGTIFHYDGDEWTQSYWEGGNIRELSGTSGNNVYAVGTNGTVISFDGNSWTKIAGSILSSNWTEDIEGIWGNSGADVFAVASTRDILHYDGSTWQSIYLSDPSYGSPLGIWGSSSTDVFAIHSDLILHYNGNIWTEMDNPLQGTTTYLNGGIWGSSNSDIFAVAQYGTILHYDGIEWTSIQTGFSCFFYDIWGTAHNDVFAVGSGGVILHYDGDNWTEMPNPFNGSYWSPMAIWGSSSNDVFAVGGGGMILHYDGIEWATMQSGVSTGLSDVWGRAENDVFAVGANGTILHYNGIAWSKMNSGTSYDFTTVWESLEGDVFVGGEEGTILYSSVLIADFTALEMSGNVPFTVHFIDQSSGAPVSWQWDFNNDGVIDSTDQHPSWTYQKPGRYSVSLTVNDGTDEDTELRENYIFAYGLVAYYPFSGNAEDESGNENNGTINGTTLTSDGFGRLNSAYAFNGIDSSITTSIDINPSNMPELTLSAWVYPRQTRGRRQIVSHDDGGYDRSLLIENDHWNIFTGGDNWDTEVPIDLNAWQHLVAVFSNAGVTFYKNGIKYTHQSLPGTSSSQNTLTIGKNPGPYNEYFDGVLDEIRIYNYVLTEPEILSLYEPGSSLIADFIATPVFGDIPLTVQFTDHSNGAPTSWQWDFDNDGIVDSEEQHPLFTYNTNGRYSVKLSATNNKATYSTLKTEYIEVGKPDLVASQIYIPTSATVLSPLKVSWRVNNSGTGTANQWNDCVYLSSDTIFDTNDTLLYEFTRTKGLTTGSDYWQTETVQIPNVASGQYYILVETDSRGTVNETNEENNRAIKPITITNPKLMTAVPDRITLNLQPESPVTGKITIRNVSDSDLSGISATVQNAPANIAIQLESVPSNLTSWASGSINYTITANDDSILEREATIEFTINGVPETFITLELTVIPASPRLIANPGYLESGMLRNEQRVVKYELSNTGGVAANDLQVLAPSAPWLKLISPEQIGTLAPGEKADIQLLLYPAADLPLGPYTGSMVIAGSNASLNIGFRFIAVSEAVGGLKVTAKDEFSYFADGKPNVSGATVIVKDVVSGTIITQGVTDETGIFFAEDINEGVYDLEVRAEKHSTHHATIEIVPGIVREVEAFLQRQLVTYTWTVVPVEIEDHYNVTLEAVFEAHVPAPVVTVEPYTQIVPLFEGEATTINLTITNHGLIAARGVTLGFFENEEVYAEPQIREIGILSPMTSIVVPIKVWAKEDAPINSIKANSGILKENSTSNSLQTNPCDFLKGRVEWFVICGLDNQLHRVPFSMKWVKGILGAFGGTNATRACAQAIILRNIPMVIIDCILPIACSVPDLMDPCLCILVPSQNTIPGASSMSGIGTGLNIAECAACAGFWPKAGIGGEGGGGGGKINLPAINILNNLLCF